LFGDRNARNQRILSGSKIEKCEKLAAGAVDKSERESWLGLAHRWETLLQRRTPDVEVLRIEHAYFRKRYYAARPDA